MTTQTSLSLDTWASPKTQRVYSAPEAYRCEDWTLARYVEGLQWHRHSCLCAFAAPMTQQMGAATLSLPFEILIANLELEFTLSPIRINDLKFSNRKFSRFFTLSCEEFVPHFSPIPLGFLRLHFTLPPSGLKPPASGITAS